MDNFGLNLWFHMIITTQEKKKKKSDVLIKQDSPSPMTSQIYNIPCPWLLDIRKIDFSAITGHYLSTITVPYPCGKKKQAIHISYVYVYVCGKDFSILFTFFVLSL